MPSAVRDARVADTVLAGDADGRPWATLFGTNMIATVDPARGVHSLHSYFIRPGTPDEPVRYEVDGPVATITLARPDKANAISMQLIDEVMSLFE